LKGWANSSIVADVKIVSASTETTISPLAALNPLVRAAAFPDWACWIRRTP
jgi:hypothetical protein